MAGPPTPAAPGPAQDTGGGRAPVDAARPERRFSTGAAVAFAVGGVAFLLGSAILVASSRGAGGSVPTGELSAEIASLREELAKVSSGPGAIPARVEELKARLEKLSSQIARLEGTLSEGGPGRIAELEKALREAEAAIRAGEDALMAKGMRGPLFVFRDAARKARKGGARVERKAGPEPQPQKPPAATRKADKEVF